MKKLALAILTTASLFVSNPIQAEVEVVSISWYTAHCDAASCTKKLEQSLKKLRGVGELRMDFEAGHADLFWKSRIPFDYPQVDLALRRIGLSTNDVRLRVRGTISHSGQRFFIQSIGDSTRIELFSLPLPSTTLHVEYNNIKSYVLNSELQRKLLDAEKKSQVVTIEGPLFEPETPPLKLIVEQTLIQNQDTPSLYQNPLPKSPAQ